MSGLAPAPSPLVIFSPIWIFVPAFDFVKACLSVLTAIKSTPFMPSSIILFTALFPAPPTPITFIVAVPSIIVTSSHSIIKISSPLKLYFDYFIHFSIFLILRIEKFFYSLNYYLKHTFIRLRINSTWNCFCKWSCCNISYKCITGSKLWFYCTYSSTSWHFYRNI